jgi:hypothetical protein
MRIRRNAAWGVAAALAALAACKGSPTTRTYELKTTTFDKTGVTVAITLPGGWKDDERPTMLFLVPPGAEEYDPQVSVHLTSCRMDRGRWGDKADADLAACIERSLGQVFGDHLADHLAAARREPLSGDRLWVEARYEDKGYDWVDGKLVVPVGDQLVICASRLSEKHEQLAAHRQVCESIAVPETGAAP